MNHLAHALLAGHNDDVLLGSLMGDFVRGAIDRELAVGIRDGIALHRAIDVFTDAHPLIVEARAHFRPPFRRYAGILLDIWFDHLLARDFAQWSTTPLATFNVRVITVLDREHERLPQNLQRFARYMRSHGLLATYADREVIARVLAGVGSRLKRDNPLADGLVEIARLERLLGEVFAAFYPQLSHHARMLRAAQATGADAERNARMPWRVHGNRD